MTRSFESRPAASAGDIELLAWLLDNSIPIPGTGRRIGLDAVIGLLAAVGLVALAFAWLIWSLIGALFS